MANTYWENNGKQQKIYARLWEKLVPMSGPATTKAGELLRATTRVYYRWFNDGDRIEPILSSAAADSSTVNGWGFLYTYRDGEFSGAPLALTILSATSESDYEAKLEEMVDAVLIYLDNAPEEPNDTDFTEEQYAKAYNFEIEEDDEEDYFDDEDEDY